MISPRRLVTSSVCNPYCFYHPDRIPTSIIPFYRCRYHAFLESLGTRLTSPKRDRKILEFDFPERAITVYAVFIEGERCHSPQEPKKPEDLLERVFTTVVPQDLSYIVVKHRLDTYVFDARTKRWFKIDFFDLETVFNRLKYDLFTMVKQNRINHLVRVISSSHSSSQTQTAEVIF